jgi:hypothetical protein
LFSCDYLVLSVEIDCYESLSSDGTEALVLPGLAILGLRITSPKFKVSGIAYIPCICLPSIPSYVVKSGQIGARIDPHLRVGFSSFKHRKRVVLRAQHIAFE